MRRQTDLEVHSKLMVPRADGDGVEWTGPARWRGPLIIIVGGMIAAAVNVSDGRGGLMVIVIGLTLVLAAKASPGNRWMLMMALPFVGLGCSVTAAALIPFLDAHLTTTVLITLGISIIAADSLAAPAPAWPASLAVVVIAAGYFLVAVGPPNTGIVIPGWAFGASLAVFGLVVGAADRYRPRSAPADRIPPRASGSRPTPRIMVVRGALLLTGAVGASLVDRLDHNLYQVVTAFGIAYLLAGVATKMRRWTESGMLLTAFGAVIVATDFVPAAATYIYSLTFGAIAAAMLLVQTFSLGRIGGVGRSLITISVFLFILSVLPDLPPFGPLRANVDVLLPLLPAGNGIALLIRAWVRSGRPQPNPANHAA